jgi:hypothetical protein
MQARASELTVTLMWGALAVWSARCAAMNALLTSKTNGFADGLVDLLLARKRKAKTKAKQNAEKRFLERMKTRVAKQAAWQARHGGAATASPSIAQDRPRRTLLTRTRAQRLGDFISQPTEEEERLEIRGDLLKGTDIVFPSF